MPDLFETEGLILGIIAAIDSNFHRGYAAEHPELVAAMVQAAATRELADAVREASSTVWDGLHQIANGMPD